MASFKQAVSKTLDAGISIVDSVGTIANTANKLVTLGANRVDQWTMEQQYTMQRDFADFQVMYDNEKNMALVESDLSVEKFKNKSADHQRLWDARFGKTTP